MSLSAELASKAVQAAVAAIEIYNKPNFSYREEAFSLLMLNGWELLLKTMPTPRRTSAFIKLGPSPNVRAVPRMARHERAAFSSSWS